jgi:diaminopimelate dehydrogenase
MKVGIAGYGNIGRALELICRDTEDVELTGVYTRRNTESVKALGTKVYSFSSLLEKRQDIDVLFLCYGSSGDLPKIAPSLAALYNTVDSYDNHSLIEGYKFSMDIAARSSGNVSLISVGWDPGFLSLIRLYSYAFLPNASVNTFWGRGVSRGHTEALCKIDGVRHAVQYTLPVEDALTLASLVCHPLTDTERHRRACYIVADEDKVDSITEAVMSMDGYFKGYKTELHFISEDEFFRYHTSTSHRGRVYALGSSGRYRELKHSLYLDLDIGSNPDFTASVMIAGARALMKIKKDGGEGAYTPFDIPPSYFAPFKCENVNKYL